MDFDENVDDLSDNVGELNIHELLLIEEDSAQTQYKSMKDCVIFLVDCRKSMMTNNAVNKVLAVAESFLKTKIITNEKDIFGLILYNTEITLNNFNFAGINIKIALAPPDAALIQNLKTLQQCTNPEIEKNYIQYLRDNFPTASAETSLASAFTVCHSEFKNFDEKSHNKRIFLFTDNDSPMSKNISDRNITIQRAKDMLESDIIIELFPMNFNHSFNMNQFYSNIIPMTVDSNEDMILNKENCEDRLRELTKRIRQKEVKKRTLGKCHFFLTKDVKFYVNFFATVKKTAKPRSFNVDARTNKTLNTVTQSICKETGGILYQNQIGTFQAYGNIKVPFSKEEMKQIKTFDSPGIKLMGFKSFDSIKPYYNVRESYFLYPDENLTSGASQLCDALIKQLVNKNKVAIVKFIPREGANIRFCALVPQKEVFDEDYFQTPPGFNLIFLPFADEVRSTADIFKKFKNKEEMRSAEGEITKDQSDAARRLIKKMNINFDSRNFENPTVQKFYATLQALALGEQDIEHVEDYINPNEDALGRVLQGCDKEFKDLFWGSNISRVYIPPVKKEAKSRKRNDDMEVSSVASKDKSKSSKRGKKTNQMIIDDRNESSLDWDNESSGKSNVKKATSANIKKSAMKNKNNIKEEEDGNNVKEKDNVDMIDVNDYSDENLLKMIEQGLLHEKLIKDLKEICNQKGIKVANKSTKQKMIGAIQDYLFSQIN